MKTRKSKQMSRRKFLQSVSYGVAAGMGSACLRESSRESEIKKPAITPKPLEKKPELNKPPVDKWMPFPEIEAQGTPFELGQAVGAMSKERIIEGIELRRKWFDGLKGFALEDRKNRLDGFIKATKKHHPAVAAEIEGLAKGAELPEEDIWVLNLQTELGALKHELETCDDCSTLHLKHGDKIFLIHNEDGDNAYRHLMMILHLKPKGSPAITSLAYPGIVPGNVPAMNSAGLIMSTNFVGVEKARIGIPRYVLGRAVLEAKSFDEATKILTDKNAAYSFHVNLGWAKTNKLAAVDVAPGISEVLETEGLFIQTNHFVLPKTKELKQPGNTPEGSSLARYAALSEAKKKLPPLDQVKAKHLIEMLSSHETAHKPYSPCRHPAGKSTGRTLATALFDITQGTFTLFEGNPCEGRKREIRAPLA